MVHVFLLVWAAACSPKILPESTEATSQAEVVAPEFIERAEKGVTLELYEADEQDPASAGGSTALAPATPLGARAVDVLTARLPPLNDVHGDRTAFALRKGSKPPPLPGSDVSIAFPPDARSGPPLVSSGTLSIVRRSPEGAVPLAPHVSMTFDRPMVAVSSHDEAQQVVPAVLTPEVDGRWRWLGTKTLVFDPVQRMPMATSYTVTVPAGTKAVDGVALVAANTFQFATPPLSLTSSWPSGGSVPLAPTVVLRFDQRVDPPALLPHLTLAGGGQNVPVRLATAEELAADTEATAHLRDALPETWLALRPVVPLRVDTHHTVTVATGAPSAEGPRPTTSPLTSTFRTYGPLRIEEHHCWWQTPCDPQAEWSIVLSNPLAADTLNQNAITVSPEVEGLHVREAGTAFQLSGAFVGRTAYTVTVPAGLTDIYGQTLGADQTVVFRVGPAQKTLSTSGETMVVLDPAGGAKLPLWSTNHNTLKVTVHRVTPKNWRDWSKWLESFYYDDSRPKTLPGQRVHSGTITPPATRDALVSSDLDLSPYLMDGAGQFVVLIEPTIQPRERWNRQYVAAWVQVTKLSLVAVVDETRLVGWATTLADGVPAADVSVGLLYGDSTAMTTATDGLASLALPSASSEVSNVLVAQRGGDVALLPEFSGPWGSSSWHKQPRGEALRWYVADDRGLYRPGETAQVFGWVRRDLPGPTGDLAALGKTGTIAWTLADSMGNTVLEGKAPVSALGGFTLALPLPADVNLGPASLSLDGTALGLDAAHHYHGVNIEEFRRPEFEVTVTPDSDRLLLGERSAVSLQAAYFAGGGLMNADVSWSVTAAATTYVPPGWQEYQFGTSVPWWWHRDDATVYLDPFQGVTNARGEHRLGFHAAAVNPAVPHRLHFEGTAQDVNRQAFSAGTDILLHPSTRTVGLKLGKAFVDPKQSFDVSLVTTDLDGGVHATDVAVTFARIERQWRSGALDEAVIDPVACNTTTSTGGLGVCTFTPVRGGEYRITAMVTDSHGRKSESQASMWVSGAASVPARDVALEAAVLIPDVQHPVPGDTVHILVQAPFVPASGLMTLARDGIVSTKRFEMSEPTLTLELPITEAYVPGLTVQIDLTGRTERTDDDGKPRPDLEKRVAHASGTLTFDIAPVSRTLQVSVAPQAETVAPGSSTVLNLRVKRADGTPVSGAQLAVVVADEAVLALTGYRLPDPIAVFYAARGAGISTLRSRDLVALASPGGLIAPESDNSGSDRGEATGLLPPAEVNERSRNEPGGGQSKLADAEKKKDTKPKAMGPARALSEYSEADSDSSGPAIALRADLSALALFVPDVATDAAGNAVVPLTLPDSLTRYRIMVVAVDAGNAFGSADAAITARLPLMVRPSAPRFLNFGDQFELPIVVQNQSPTQITVDVAVRGTNVRFIDAIGPTLPDLPDVASSSMGKRIVVPANDRVEVRFPAATLMAGTARFQAVGAVAGGASDAQSFTVPVWTPATTEAFATYGSIEGKGVVQPVKAPANTWPQFGGLEVTTSSTQLQALTDAVIYLQSYPFECNEQLASRILAIASLRDVLDAFDAEGLPPKSDLEAQVASDLARLAVRQHWNGGFAFWRRGDEPWPFLSVHVANAFARAKGKGFTVPDEAWQRSLSHLRNIERHIPAWYSVEAKWFLRAYALDVRHRMGESDVSKARDLYREAGTKLGIDALGFLLPTLHAGKATTERDAILKHIGNNTTESAGTAHFVTSYSDGAQVLLHSDRRADGIVLEALIEIETRDEELVEKVVRGLLGHKTKGRWGNTQENAFVLLALDRYFRVYEKQTPDFVARVWLGEDYAGDHTFKGRTTERAHIDIPMGLLTEYPGTVPLTLVRDGDAGRMYYRIGMRYAPRDLRLDPRDEGFAVSRRYEAVDDPGDVHQAEDGSWQVKAGARVKVVLSMATPMRRNHVALVDPMPAGFEAENPALATTGALPPQPPGSQEGYWWWTRTWWEHENLRDERVEAFTSLLWDGVHTYEYIARATTPGRFVVPPARAEEMYAPETMGRTGTDQVVIR